MHILEQTDKFIIAHLDHKDLEIIAHAINCAEIEGWFGRDSYDMDYAIQSMKNHMT